MVTAAFAVIAVALAGTVLGLAASAGATTAHSVAATTAARSITATTAKTATARHHRDVVLDCGQRQVRPGSYVLACADDGQGLQGLRWTSWTARLASGYGTFYENDCVPNCAAGHVRHYRADVTLWQTAKVPGHAGERQYTRITVLFPGRHRPPVDHRENGKLVVTHPRVQTFGAF